MRALFGIFSAPAPTELIVLLVIAVLLFGRNLPEVARSLGQKLAEFKRGMRGMEDEIRSITSDITSDTPSRPTIANSKPRDDPNVRDEPTAPKFEPPPG